MGKLKPRPADYRPELEFGFRDKREGGGVRMPGSFGGRLEAQGRPTCIVLVHGFNNNDGEAAAAYDGFRQRHIEQLGADLADLNGRLGDAFWTGDAGWGFFDFLDFGVYPTAVGNARRTAAELREMLLRMPNLMEVDFIGHSLGSRLILETLEQFRAHGDGPRIRRVCLMAAAVPMEMVEPGGKYFDLLNKLAVDGTEILVLHSRQDKVLHLAFGAGQALAGPDERSSRALGRDGPHPLMPGFGGTMRDVQVSGASHGDYWGHSNNEVSRAASKETGRFLGLGVTARELVTARTVGVVEPGYGWRPSFDLSS